MAFKLPRMKTLAILLVLLPLANATTLSRRATILSGGGFRGGRCTVEVDVDGAAEVTVSGDRGQLRTLSGQAAVWRRFECTAPLPRNMGDFRFQRVGGRGNQSLVRDPRSNRGTAVVRIDDPKGGRANYTFDLEWRGGGGGGGDWLPPPSRPGPGPGPGGRYPMAQAIENCQDGVVDRLNRDGYQYIDFLETNPDNRPGRNDWITGTVTGKRGFGERRFSFSCSVDFSTGRVRSVDVNRR
jgi:hypothetical protein